jgi:outer membrane protein TolC
MVHRYFAVCRRGVCALVSFGCLLAVASAQESKPVVTRLPSPVVTRVAQGNPQEYPSTQPTPLEVMPIDMGAAWELAARQNPTIGWTRQVVQERLANLLQARVIAVPSLNAGTTIHAHNGAVEGSAGDILRVPGQSSLYVGGGAAVAAAGTVNIPAVSIFAPVADVVYEPLAARQFVAASQFDVRATFNSILLDVSTQYLELVGAEAWFAALRHSEFDMADIVRPTLAFAAAGQGSEADANRARSEALLLRARVQAAEGDIAVAAARLSKLLQLNPAVALRAPDRPLAIVTLVNPREELSNLVETALRYRPEMGARSSEVAGAEVRYRQERMRPLLPTMSMGFSSGTFGGGSMLVDPVYGSFSGRNDFDVMALWTLQNAGMGNVARWRQRRAEVGETTANRVRMINQIRKEVAAAQADTAARRREVDYAILQLQTAEIGFIEEVRRARGGEGLPIEALNLIDLLVNAREDLIRATVAYNQAEFRLFVALGWPPIVAVPLTPPQEVPDTTQTSVAEP